MIPGEVLVADGTIMLNPGRPAVTLVVVNTADRPVQVGSHYHFAQANPALRFDRAAALGCRLDIAAGTAVRFEPGVEREVTIVPLAGARRAPGLRRDGTRSGPVGSPSPGPAGGSGGSSSSPGPAGGSGGSSSSPGPAGGSGGSSPRTDTDTWRGDG